MFSKRKYPAKIEYWDHKEGRWRTAHLKRGQTFVYRLSGGKRDTIDVVRVHT